MTQPTSETPLRAFRGIHLVQELMDGYDVLLVVDALERGGAPGTVHVLEAEVPDLADWPEGVDNFLRHPVGVGLGSTDIEALRFGVTPLTADNQYLRYAVELGALGLVLHVAILAGALAAGVRAWSAARGQPVGWGGTYGLLLAVTVLGIGLNAVTAVVFNSMMLAYLFYWLAGSVTTIAQPPAGAAA